MSDGLWRQIRARLMRTPALILAALVGAGLLTGCGASSTSPDTSTSSVVPFTSTDEDLPSDVPPLTISVSTAAPTAIGAPGTTSAPPPAPTTHAAPATTHAAPPPPATTAAAHGPTVTPGAYCADSQAGQTGYSAAGNEYRCSLYPNGRYRWKRI